MAEVYGERRRPRKRWGRRLLITLIVLLVLLGIIAAVVDRFGKSYAERVISDRVAEQVTNQEATSEKPDVTVEGVPFLTQVLNGRVPGDQDRAEELRRAGRQRARPSRCRCSTCAPRTSGRRWTRCGPGRATSSPPRSPAPARVDYATLAELTNREGVKLGEKDGKLAVTAPLEVLNQTVTVNGTANLEVTKGNVVRIRFEQVTAEGLPDIPLVRNLLNNYAKQISVDVKVPALPLKLVVQKVQPTAEGLVVTAGASEVPLNAGGL